MKKLACDSIIIFCDGACSCNPGPGGWGAIVATPNGRVWELGGGIDATTNNQMELMAATEALSTVADLTLPISLYTDSTYVIRGITEWISGWKRRGWKSSEGKGIANREFWERLSAVTRARNRGAAITWKYVQGHAGIPGNDRVDAIAVTYSRGEEPKLYSGSRAGYSIDLDRVVAEVGIARRSSKGEKRGQAYSYLSLLEGVPMRHSTWKECEARVKKQSNAKFKKAMSELEEDEILKRWGVDPRKVNH